MTSKNNYCWKTPSSSFSQLDMSAHFNKNFMVRLISAFCKPVKVRSDGHSGEEFPIVTLFNALAGYSQRTGTQILNHKLEALLKDDSPFPVNRGRILPHPSQMRSYAKLFPMKDANQKLLSISKEFLSSLVKKGLLSKKIKIAFDFHKELYYGEKDNPYVIGIKAEKGTKKAHMWHTCSLIVKGRELHVGSEMRKQGVKTGIFVQKMVEFLISLGFTIELIAMDKQYYQKWIFDYLDRKNITYIVPVKGSKKLRAMKEAALTDPKARVQPYEMKGTYVKGKGYIPNNFNVAFYGKKDLNFGVLRAQYLNGTRPRNNILADIFVLATNQLIHSPSVKKKYAFYSTRRDYGARWRIEINYREGNPLIIYSTSADPNVRNFYFILSLLLYNFWVIANVLLHHTQYWKAKEPKAYYIEDVKLVLVNAFLSFMNKGPPLSDFCRKKKKKEKRWIII
jgi:hypothetical protein